MTGEIHESGTYPANTTLPDDETVGPPEPPTGQDGDDMPRPDHDGHDDDPESTL